MGLRQDVNLKIPFGRKQGLMKFLVAPKSMRVEVLTVCLIPYREIWRQRVLFSRDATSTWFNAKEGDVVAASLFKNPMPFALWGGKQILWLTLQVVLHNIS